MVIETFPFDAAEFLERRESQASLLSDALASGDATYMANALGEVARARGMTEIAREAGLTREALFDALMEASQQRSTPLLGVLKALERKLTVAA